ncbi:MAG: alanine racemase [Gemmatimonadetes bacterium]|nr:alanine racemase [Gemmatimonadota bacterium]
MNDPTRYRAWIEVELEALRRNFQLVRRRAGPNVGVLPMVKADAYGLGVGAVVGALEPLAPAGYGVATTAEGIELRELGVSREVIVFSPMPPQDVARAAAHGLTATVSDLEAVARWAEAGRARPGLSFHVAIDTGMGREGFDWRECLNWAPELVARAGDVVRWSGVYTHFHSSDSADRAATAEQWARFQDALARLPVVRDQLIVHAANSAAAVRWPEFAGDLVRPGIFLYGGQPAEPGVACVEPEGVVAVQARTALAREAPPGTAAGYGATHVSRGWARWATVAIGYGDGLPRCLGNQGQLLVHGRRVPMIGRISMDMTVVDITGLAEVAVGDVATIIGQSGSERITVAELAEAAGTISYEILTGFTPRLARLEREHE